MKNNRTSLLTSNHKRNLFLLLIIPFVVFLLWSKTKGVADNHVNELNGSQLLQQAQTTVVSNSDIYGLLDKNISTYTPVDITEGLDGTKLTQYFSPLRARSNFTTPGTPTPEPEEIPEVWPTAVTFIYKGQNVNYAILDGVLIREGGLTPDGLTLSTIENNRVLIKGKRSERWITLEF